MLTLHVLGVDDELGMRHGLERALAAYQADIPDIGDAGDVLVEVLVNPSQSLCLLSHSRSKGGE